MRSISVTSNARLFLAHLPHGSVVEEEVQEFLKAKAFSVGHVEAWGELEEATVELMTPEGPVTRTLSDTVVSFRATGLVTPDDPVRLHGWIAAHVDGEWVTHAGILVHGRALSVEARIEAYAETVLERVANPVFGSLVWRNAAAKRISSKLHQEGAKVPTLGSAPSRFDRERSVDAGVAGEGSPSTLRKGDVVIHHAFGECEVLEVLDSEDVVRLKVKGPPAREVRLALRVLSLELVEQRKDGRAVYKAHKRGR